MGYETSRRALRTALPPLLFGFLVWVASVGLHALSGFDLASGLRAHLPLERIAAILGALASGLVLVGGAQLLRARARNRPVTSAVVFFLLWLVELVLRLWTLATHTATGDATAGAPGASSGDLLPVRILVANLAMLALSAAMLRIAGEGVRRPEIKTWNTTAKAFALQLVLGGLLWYGLSTGGLRAPDGSLQARCLDAALWVVLVAPYAHAYLSLQRSASKMAATETVAEILTR